MAPGNLKTLDGPDSYTIAWIAALPIERAAAEAMLDEQHEQPDGFSRNPSDPNSYTWGRIREHNIVIVSLAAGVYGLGSAAATASSLSSSLPAIRVGLLVGVGGGIARPDEDHDIRLGDVVVSQPDGTTGGVCQYDLVKAKPGDVREQKGFLASPPRVLLNAIANIQAVHERKDSEIPRFLQNMLEANPKMAKKTKKNPGYIHQGFENDRLFQSSYGHVAGQDCRSCETAEEVQREERESTDPEIHYGIIASGNTLVKDAVARDQIIADVGHDCICFEMEAAGLMNHFPCLVIRGICDYADSHKNDRWQRYASATAAAYAKELLGYVPAAEVQDSRRALEILESVNEKIETAHNATIDIKATLESLRLDSHDQKIRQWLAAPDQNTNANHARELRHEGTGSWLLETPIFQQWTSGTHKHLWLRGIPGCGKTVISAVILDHLTAHTSENQAILSFFFDFSEETKQTKSGLLRSIALQLYLGGFDSAGHLNSAFRATEDRDKNPNYTTKPKKLDENEKLTTATLENIVRAILAAQQKVIIVIDALDESTTRDETLLWIRNIFTRPELCHVQMIYSSREEAEFLRDIPDLIGQECCVSLDEDAIDDDIRAYVTARLQRDPSFTRKRLSEILVRQIQNKVGNGAKRMFRWAACQLDSLARCLSPRDVEKTLDMLPTTLTETYDRMLQNIPHSYWNSTMRLLQFIVYANRPLTLQEAVEIVATEVEDELPCFDLGRRLFDDNDILRHCASLVSVIYAKNESGIRPELHLAHFSVKEYILVQAGFGRIDASITITKACLIYLRDIDGRGWELADKFPLAPYAAQVWMDFAPVAECSGEVAAMILSFMQSEETFQRWHYFDQADLFPWSFERPRRASPLYYACINGLTEVTKLIVDSGVDINAPQGGYCTFALQAASHGGHHDIVRFLLEKGAIANAEGGHYISALQAASNNGHLDVVNALLDNHADVNARSEEGEYALISASEHGYLNVVETLLDHGADVDCTNYVRDGAALVAACSSGHIEVAQLLLERGAYFEVEDGRWGGALKGACAHGHLDVVRLLLDKGADMWSEGGSTGNILQAASYGGNKEIVKMLIELGADVNAEGGEDGSALQAACSQGHESVVKTLLYHGAEVNTLGGKDGSPLHAALINGSVSIVNALREAGADVAHVAENHDKLIDNACSFNKIPTLKFLVDVGVDIAHESKIDEHLQTACYQGHHDVIKWLVDAGVNVNAWGGERGSPLQAACEGWDKDTITLLVKLGAEVNNTSDEFGFALQQAAAEGKITFVEMLIAMGADVNTHRPKSGVASFTALFCASYGGHLDTVRMLLANGAEVSLREDAGRTPFYAAAWKGHVEVATLLIEAGANINTADDASWTPIIAASSEGHVEVVKLLLENGADVSASDEDGRTPLDVAMDGGHSHLTQVLLEKGASISGTTEDIHKCLISASSKGHVGLVKLLLEKWLNNSANSTIGSAALYGASKHRNVKIANLLLDRGAEVSKAFQKGWTPLHIAASWSADIARLLLERGADASLATDSGWTPLLIASSARNVDCVAHLLHGGSIHPDYRHPGTGRSALSYAAEGGAGGCSVVELLLTWARPYINVDSGDFVGRTPLHFAAREGFNNTTEVLLNCGTSVDLPDSYGSTPLSLAARMGHTTVVKTLLAAGANRASQDCFNRTPMCWAKRRGNTDVVDVLLEEEDQRSVMADDSSSSFEFSRPRLRGRPCDDCDFGSPIDCDCGCRFSDLPCDICNILILGDCIYHQCVSCNGGDFNICDDCFTSGGHCLNDMHTLFWKKFEPDLKSDVESKSSLSIETKVEILDANAESFLA